MPGHRLASTEIEWPRHREDRRPWRQARRGGARADRQLTEVVTRRPPLIATQAVPLPAATATVIDEATRSIATLDHSHGGQLAALAVLLLRTESVASSKIEHVEASLDDYARALHGVKANDSATSMVASTVALDRLVRAVSQGRDITRGIILSAHHALICDPIERSYAGRLRDVQNWIGGSDFSPRGALYVPPPPETVPDYVDDVLSFANRDDLPAMAQSAIAHAQFESIHPFTDGNGRIGRALVNAILRRRGTTTRVVIPLASALVGRREAYFDVLDSYRDGDAGPIVTAFADAARIAARESLTTAERIAGLSDRWRAAAGRPRRGSAASAILDGLMEHPIFTTDEAAARVGGASSSVYSAVAQLHEAAIIRPLTQRLRNQVWGAVDLLDELDDLARRIESAARFEM